MEKRIENAASQQEAAFFSLVNQPLKFKLFLLRNLPAAYFSGVRVVKANNEACTVSVPFEWFTKNPFRSTYFACLSMAAEMSTGVLALANLYGRKAKLSMLITGMEAAFHKKAKGLTIFTCNDGRKIADAVSVAISSGQAVEVKAQAVGKNEAGELVAEFWFTWSFKAK